MNASDIVREVRSLFEKESDRSIADKYSRYFVEGYDPYGVSAEVIVAKVKEVIGRGIDLHTALKASDDFIGSQKYEEGHFAIAMIKRLRPHYTNETLPAIARWFDFGIANWAHDDSLCGDVVSSLLIDEHAGLSDIAPWALSPHKYQRRALPVSLIKMIGSEKVPLDHMLKAVESLFDDEEKVVHQGLGWFLREAWKKYPEEVEELLLKHRDTGARVVFQYATEKMSKQKKEEFRRNPRK